MRFRDTLIGRTIRRVPGGDHIIALGRAGLSPYYSLKSKRALILWYKQNIRQARTKTGIRYAPLSGFWPPFLSYPPDMWFAVTFPDAARMKIHLTEERGYEDIDGMAHLRLYRQFATEIVPSLKPSAQNISGPILDCACGSGYGSNYLSETLQCPVVGVDVEETVLRYAQKRYATGNPLLTFLQADATDLHGLASGSVRAVISVETIEHIPDADRALAEFRRVLQPGGVLFISSPDATDRPDTLMSAFHVREYSHPEFADLLKRHFPCVDVFLNEGHALALCRLA